MSTSSSTTSRKLFGMQLIPAIDLKEGACVRLKQGRMDDNTVFSDDPVATAARWVAEGSDRLHIVDLDGAFAGAPKNTAAITAICQAHPELKVQIGGGIRNDEIAASYLEAGVDWVIIGTQAVREPQFVTRLCKAHPGQVIVGLDARDGAVALNGWAEDSSLSAVGLARSFEGEGVAAIVYTDISRDGMMQGFNVEATAELARAVDIPVIASGGVSSYKDVDQLCAIAADGVSGAIVGRALYEGTIQLSVAVERARATLESLQSQSGRV